MEVNNINSAHSANKADKSKETGKHEAYEQHSHVKKDKKEGGMPTQEDIVEISDAVKDKKEKGDKDGPKVGKGFADFDMDTFQGAIRSQLMEAIYEAKKSLKDAGVEFVKFNEKTSLYDVPEDTETANVPDYWNAENTSQRIVDFAMSFRSLAPELADEEYIEQMRKAVQEGFKQAAGALGDLPGASAKLFNDTYNLAMSKFDEFVEQARKNAVATNSEATA